ncbi:MAG: GMC family oxidoreductase N-terminal domain-containing protein, partial [Elusimicrobiota bacterium]
MSFGERQIVACGLAWRRRPGDEDRAAEKLRRRIRLLPWWGFIVAGSAAFALRWLMPLIILGRPVRFESLRPEEADLLLERLQRVAILPVRGPFLTLKSLVLPVVYGREEKTSAADAETPASLAPLVRSGPGRRWDAVVVGSGAGGSAAAAGLARGGARVLLLEQGRRPSVHRDPAEAVSRYYAASGFSAALGTTLIPIPTGAAVGGTTAVNSGTCMRTPAAMLERWERAGSGGFSKTGFEARLDEAWRLLKVRRAPARTFSRSSRLVLQGLAALGLPPAEPLDRCEDGCEGAGRCCFMCPTDVKMTAAKAFLDPLKHDPRLTVADRTSLASIRPPRKAGEPVSLKVQDLETGQDETIEAGLLVLEPEP